MEHLLLIAWAIASISFVIGMFVGRRLHQGPYPTDACRYCRNAHERTDHDSLLKEYTEE